MAKHYQIIIANYSILLVLQLGTVVYLFYQKLGWSLNSIQSFYLGDPGRFIASQSRAGLLETAVPHLAAIGLTSFIICHLLIFIPHLSPKIKWTLGLTLLLSGLFDIASGFFILYFGPSFALGKLIFAFLFQISYLAILLTILKTILRPVN
ncbi:MAG: hypothetical protein KDD35_11975 [Bdellovibrionales bacterium]|nr:hypothetical protein [Bdellovibrionales bacterium]